MSRNSRLNEINQKRLSPRFSPNLGRRCSAFAVAASLSLFLGAFTSVRVEAEDSADVSIAKLEQKFFQHDFPKDEQTDRLSRIEQLMFGETKTGSIDERVKNLLTLVPNLNAKVEEPTPLPAASEPATPPAQRQSQPQTAKRPVESYGSPEEEPAKDTNSYPAVSAIEKKLLQRDYVGESLGKRLDRLEIKAFGKTNASDDLQDRVDRLKTATGIDVAKMKPAGSEWADEEDDPLVTATDGGVTPFTGIAGEDPSQSRSYRKQMANSYGRPKPPAFDPSAGASSGTYGGGGGSYNSDYGSGTYGSGTGIGAGLGGLARGGMPPSAPEFRGGQSGMPTPAPALGVSQQISMLEKEVFKKAYSNETLLSRLNRLETTVFPQDKPEVNKALPDRVSRLLAAVPLSEDSLPPVAPKRQQRRDPDFPDLDFNSPGSISTKPSGLSKIINGLGSALGGGYTTGGYPGGGYNGAPGTLVSDPQTGLLYDQYTGTLIDPQTGAVVGRRSQQTQSYGSGFNSGFSPMSPFGNMGGGSGMQFGFGGSGMRFGGWP